MASNSPEEEAEDRNYKRGLLCAQRFQAVVTAIAAGAGIIGLIILNSTLTATQDAASAAKTQANSARRELEISHRPWIASINPAQVIGPFVFHDKADVTFTLNVPIKNTGTSTAIDVLPIPLVIIDDRNVAHDELVRQVLATNCATNFMGNVSEAIGGTPIPPGAEINYRVPAGRRLPLEPNTIVQIWLYLCLGYKDALTDPPKFHHYCVVEDFMDVLGQREFPANGTIDGTFEIANGGCAD